MSRLLFPLVALAALAPSVHAGVKFTSPEAGATLTAGTAIEIKWEESGDSPKLTDLLTYELFLCAGGNTAGENVQLLAITTQGSFAVGSAASGMVGIGVGASTPKNAYYVKMIAVGKSGGQYIVNSDRFSYSGMTGAFPADPEIQKGLASIEDTTGPASEDNTVQPGAGAQPEVGDYGMAYTMQTGPTRYAPMQPVPPKKVTAKNTSPLYPTSSVAIATTRLPIPKIQTTLTQSQTYSVSSRENTVAPAPQPTDDMAKFLNRWKD